jgi:curved DNA-binding protein CbpA
VGCVSPACQNWGGSAVFLPYQHTVFRHTKARFCCQGLCGFVLKDDEKLLRGGIAEAFIISSVSMKTLYDLLGALPDDDADRLRVAFRKAAKANHPDNNPDDPDAPLRFRQIVRGNAILRDERLRATYDWLLVAAHHERDLNARRGIFSPQVRSLARHVIAGATISLVSIGAFLVLVGYVSRTPIVAAQVEDVPARVQTLVAAAVAMQPPDTTGRAGPPDTPDGIRVLNNPKPTEAANGVAAPSADAPAETIGSLPAIADNAVKDANYYRARGALAYRSGDLSLALVDYDLAINLDPNFSDAYIDRAIVLRRMGDLKHAFADIAQAKRIDDLSRSQDRPPSVGQH